VGVRVAWAGQEFNFQDVRYKNMFASSLGFYWYRSVQYDLVEL